MNTEQQGKCSIGGVHNGGNTISSNYHSEGTNAIVKPTLIILGASARAAAASALRAGFAPWCADLFADLDLQRACPVRKIAAAEYPRGLIRAAREAPPGPWLYTGGLENWPDLVDQVDRHLWGNPADVLRRVRDPFLIHETLCRQGLPTPKLTKSDPDPRLRWLLKPRRSAGGNRIRFWKPGSAVRPPHFYLQEWIAGPSYAAVFRGRLTDADLLGVTHQLVGEAWLHAPPFHYCGSIGPATLSPQAENTLRNLGHMLVSEFGLRGLFGVDFVLRDGVPWPVEVNPRYTASVEVLERALEISALADDPALFEMGERRGVSPTCVRRFHVGLTPRRSPLGTRKSSICGKAILFAEKQILFPGRGPWQKALEMALENPAVPYADIPSPGTRIEPGQPICTAFASGDTPDACRAGLQERVGELKAAL